MPRDKKAIESALLRKGFQLAEGDHHRYFYVTSDGRKSRVHTKTSHTPKMKVVPDNILTQMARQVGLSRPQFLDLVDCPMDRAAYEEELRSNGLLRP